MTPFQITNIFFLTLFCPCLLGDCFPLLLWETRLEEVSTRQNESCKLTLFFGGGVLWETCNSHESSCRKALFVTVTLSCRLKRCWGKPSQILPCRQTVVRTKEHGRFLTCMEAQQAEGNRSHCFHCFLLLHITFVRVAFLGALRLLYSGDFSLAGVTESKPDLPSLWF